MLFKDNEIKVAVIGLGYVGLPLAIELAKKKFTVFGFDPNSRRIRNLKLNFDETNEVSNKDLEKTSIIFSNKKKILQNANVFIVTVPTGINKYNLPDLRSLKNSTKTISNYLKKKSLIIYESTVYPGCTEEICLPILKKNKKFTYNKDFFIGYSPERISPGDKKKNVTNIIKIVAASSPEALEQTKKIYSKIVKAGIHTASSIKIAESAKIIENTQRDLNIGLMNELYVFFEKLKIPMNEILDAAGTKWNFLKFTPGLVGGHCISVDPYYLTSKYKSINLIPRTILSARTTNDNFHKFIGKKILKVIKSNNLDKKKVLVLGYTFKENCPDTRNTRVYHLIKYLQQKKVFVKIHDPYIFENNEKFPFPNIKLKDIFKKKKSFDLIFLSVPHKFYLKNVSKILNLLSDKGFIYDYKAALKRNKKIIQL